LSFVDDTHICYIIGGSSTSVTNAIAKPSESAAAQRSTVVPKAPISQSPSVSSDSVAPTTPVKGMLLLLM